MAWHPALRPATLLLALACVPLAQAQTAPPIKPGLWQVKVEREVDGAKAQDMRGEHMKNMSPEMRARMESMMKQRGIDMSGGAGEIKLCLARESLDQGRWQGEQGRCKTDFTTRSANLWKWHSVCTDPDSESDSEASFDGQDGYTIKRRTTMTLRGQKRTSNVTLKGTWLGADCGDLKPIEPRAPARPPAGRTPG